MITRVTTKNITNEVKEKGGPLITTSLPGGKTFWDEGVAPAVANVMASGDAMSGRGANTRHGVASWVDEGVSTSGENSNA